MPSTGPIHQTFHQTFHRAFQQTFHRAFHRAFHRPRRTVGTRDGHHGHERHPEEHRDLATHQRATLDYGIASHRFTLDWFRDHIDRHETPNH